MKTATTTQTPPSGAGRSALLSGLGFYRLSVRRRRVLAWVFGVSLAAHAVALAVFGGWVVMRSRPEEVTVFRTPPPTRKYEPRELEHRVKVQKRQRSSSRPSMVPRMVSMKLSELALPEIKVDPKIVNTTFQPKFKAVSGKGLGAGLGTGYGTHGFGQGVSSVNFFGIRARGEKVAVLVDVSVSMVEEDRGGVMGYMRVKQRVEQVIDALSEMTMFTIIAFADAAETLEPKLMIANAENKKRAKLFIRPFNTEGNWGLDKGNVGASRVGLVAAGGTTRLDLALSEAFRQGADTILIISDGLPRVRKTWSFEEMAQHRKAQQDWMAAHANQVAAWDQAAAAWQAAAAPAQVVTEKVWVPPQPARPAIAPRPPSKRPPKEGQPPDRGHPGRPAQPAKPGYWKTVTRTVRQGGGRGPGPRPSPPPIPDPGWWTLTDFVKHLRILNEHYYTPKGNKPPQIHCIGYQIDDAGHAFLRDLSAHFRGKYRRVNRLR